ncbi:MAG: SlyX family protein [Legionella sp.]|nr:SlyX family protein [Legionella sp.]
MDDIETLQARVEALEMSRAHQERAIEDLSEALAAQWKQIEALNRQVARLADQLQEAQSTGGGGETPEPPPPHY